MYIIGTAVGYWVFKMLFLLDLGQGSNRLDVNVLGSWYKVYLNCKCVTNIIYMYVYIHTNWTMWNDFVDPRVLSVMIYLCPLINLTPFINEYHVLS